jgi:hypothetical protein
MTGDTDVAADPTRRGTLAYADGSVPGRATATLDGLDRQRQHLAFQCSGGRTIEGDWRGVPVLDLLEAADAPADTTHVLVESRDEYRVCIGLRDLPGALLAFDADRWDDAGDGDATPRLVGERIDTARAVKGVNTIRAVSLAPDEDPQSLEHLPE